MAFELRQLRYFLAVAEEGSISAAAASIPVAQQSLSEQIRSLERQLGAPLFVRGPRGVRLTAVGEELQVEARSLINQADRAFDHVQRVAGGERQTIHVGYLPSVGNYIVPPLVRAFAHTHPESDPDDRGLPNRRTRRRTARRPPGCGPDPSAASR